jgi:mRNA interferase RelE/StbE
MAKYTVSLTKKASKQLDKLPALVANQIIKSLESLGGNPRPNGCKKLRGREGYRIRIGT